MEDCKVWVDGIHGVALKLDLEVDVYDGYGDVNNREEDSKRKHALDGWGSHADHDAHAFVVSQVVNHHHKNTDSDHNVGEAKEVTPVDVFDLIIIVFDGEDLEVLGCKGKDQNPWSNTPDARFALEQIDYLETKKDAYTHKAQEVTYRSHKCVFREVWDDEREHKSKHEENEGLRVDLLGYWYVHVIDYGSQNF